MTIFSIIFRFKYKWVELLAKKKTCYQMSIKLWVAWPNDSMSSDMPKKNCENEIKLKVTKKVCYSICMYFGIDNGNLNIYSGSVSIMFYT